MKALKTTFGEFYRAIHDRSPFPWQERLAEQIARTNEWPSEIGVPTGLGKTACLDIAIWWLASQAHHKPEERTAPTRIWWVVNRRLLVDSTAEHAERLAQAFAGPASLGLASERREVVEDVSERLRALSAIPDASPLDVIRLRGGMASRTPADPSRPTVILCTLPMFGSRLLFRGYGSRLRPIEAAMAGTDSLVLLDEAHLAPHLRSLVAALPDCSPGAEAILGAERSSVRMTSLTATGDSAGKRFELDEMDEANPTVRERLDSVKPLEFRRFETGEVAKRLSDAALELLFEAQSPSACLVFANTPKTARAVFEHLQHQLPEVEAELLLLTGLAREREAKEIRARILDPTDGMPANRPGDPARERHLVMVATQTLEVGADLDAEYLVTESCGVRALTQRLGRLNRFGRHRHARAVLVHLPPPKRRGAMDSLEWPVYRGEPAVVLQRLEEICTRKDEQVVDMSPRRIAEALGPPGDDPGRAPEVLPGILWEWVKTTTPPDGEAPVEPYFSGVAGADYTVSLCWRVYVPAEGERLWPRVSDREVVDIPIVEVREALQEDDAVCRLAADGDTVELTQAEHLRPGDQVVIPTDRGLLDCFGWTPNATGRVVDASLAGHGLPLDATAIRRLCGLELGSLVSTTLQVDEDGEPEQDGRQEAVATILEALRGADTPTGWTEGEWLDFTRALAPAVEQPRFEVPRLPILTGVAARSSNDLGSDFDEMSLNAALIVLEEHGQAVGSLARQIAERIGLSETLSEVVECAGTLHDIGKADERFQRWLDPEARQEGLLAKSDTPRHRWEATRSAAGWPRGGRHEDLSGRLVRSWLEQNSAWSDQEQRDLLVHLVVSHHGKGRPLVPSAADGTARLVSAEVNGTLVEAPADLAVIDWSQPRRFRRLNDQFGPWGLALLESIVRMADHAVSAGADVSQGVAR